jgi:diguanylate cyclase (GGDEF)-like protein
LIPLATTEGASRMPVVKHRPSLARRLSLAIAAMVLPLVAAGAVGLISFRSISVALATFRADTVDEGTRIEQVRDRLVLADDAGEAAFETGQPAKAKEFAEISRQIDAGFADLAATLTPASERSLARMAEARWREASAALEYAPKIPPGPGDAQLDPFHDLIDEAASVLADVGTLNAEQVGREISALRGRERVQLVASLAALLLGAFLGGLLARRLYRSVSTRLARLEEAAARFGADDLSHRIAAEGEDELGRVGSAFNVMADRLQASRATLHHQALHDTLTGLPNRALFLEQLQLFLVRSRRRETAVSVLYLDLDGFKDVNDTLGHRAGDELLVAVADRLNSVLRAEDVVARLGGDEFVILLEDDADGSMHVARRVSRAFDDSWIVSSGVVRIGVSIGVATTDRGETPLDELLRQADVAMYAAKAAGKGGCRVFHPELDVKADETNWVRGALQQAVERDEFIVFYQPIVNLQTGGVAGVEALIRWDHSERGLLAPAAFLASAEESGEIIPIGRRVLAEATRRVRSWQREIPGAEELCLHVNLSARQLQHPGLADDVAEALRTSELRPDDLVLEITETMLVRDAKAAEAELSRLKQLNVLLALDDFGTGFSSLSHLVRFPIDRIKIDRSFVSTMAVDERSSELVQALVNLGKALRLPVIAEGIEEAAHAEQLRKMGCHQGQGNLFGGPVPADELVDLLRRDGAFPPSKSRSRTSQEQQRRSRVKLQIP